jgi:hypothetical protein
MAMETAWMTAVVVVLEKLAGPASGWGWPLLGLLYPLSYYVAGGILRVDVSHRLKRWLPGVSGVLGLAFAALILLPPKPWEGIGALTAFCLIGAVYWVRGWSLAGRTVDVAGMARGFGLGLAVLALFLAAFPLVLAPWTAAWSLAAAFLIFGLWGLGHTRRGDEGRGFPGVWGPLIVLVLAVGWLGGAVVDKDFLHWVLAPLFRLGEWAAWLYDYLVGPWGPPEPSSPLPTSGGPPIPRDEGLTRALKAWPEWTRSVGRIMFIGGSSVLFLGALFRLLADLLRLLRRRTADPLIAVERLDGGFWADLAALAMAFVQAWMKRALKVRAWLAGSNPTPAYSREIRRTYGRFLAWGAKKGRPRKPWETPRDYLGVWRPRLTGDLEEDLDRLTRLFEWAEYGGQTARREADGSPRDLWRRIRPRLPRKGAWTAPEPAGDLKKDGRI